jgi:short-subunit dehydrogenase
MEQRVVIVTGASSGIGWAVARWAAAKEFRVVLAARREDRLRDLAARIEEDGGTALVVPVDIAKPEDQRRLIDETVRAFGRIDVLVNNAGLPLPTPFSESSPEELRRQWDVNVTTLATLTRRALPYLEQHRHELHPGTVVNVGSSISRFAVPGMGNYSPTKIAVAGLSEALRRELEPRGVHVCLVEPGPVATEFGARAGDKGVVPSRLVVPAAKAARAIVRLFDHPQRRIVIPARLGPVLTLAGGLAGAFPHLVDAVVRRALRQGRFGRFMEAHEQAG